MKKLKRNIKIGGVDFEQRFYFERNEAGKPVVTVCVLNTPNFSEIARGVCICSATDQIKKEEYKKEASKRARVAYHTKESSEPIGCIEVLRNLHDAGLVSEGEFYQDIHATTDLGESILNHGKSVYLTGVEAAGLTEKEAHLIRLPVEDEVKVAEA